MATQPAAQNTRPDRDHIDSLPGFSVPPPVWLAPPATSFEFFDITSPRFYMVHGTPMAFAGEVTHV